MQIPQTEVIISKDGVELVRHVVTPGEYVIGRGEDVDFHMDTPLASRQHARLIVNYDEWLIEDLASANGTFLNERPVPANEWTRVFPTQTLRVGDATVTLRRLRGSEAPDVSLAPSVAAGRTLLPEEVRARRYAIGQVVAQGGMGAILSAQDQAIRRNVAMKVMLQSSDTGDLARFVEEAQITGQLEHPNIVPIYELSVDEQDQFFYTMKFVRGITLKKVLELLADDVEATAKKYPLGALLTIFQKVCDALAFAHSKRVIHRDLKPENIMLGDFGSVLVMDWGLAKVLKQERAPGAHSPVASQRSIVMSARSGDSSVGSTMSGAILGTPQYMAPEQARGEIEALDERSDIYALGAILFHILHLRPAVSGTDAWDIVEKVGKGALDWTPPKKPAPDSLLAICRKALALDPAQRYASVEHLQRDVEAFQNGFATSAENAGLLKRASLAIKRNKTASLAATLVLLIGGTLGTKAIVEGRRSERALAELKKSAPAMLALAESEAVGQHFDSELEKADVALRLDPNLLPAYWRRAWCLVALGRFTDAATALRTAGARDPVHAPQFIGILPQIEKIAALPDESARYAPEAIAPVFDFLNAHDIRGEAGALITHLKLGNDKRLALARDRLNALCGSTAGLTQKSTGLIELNFAGSKLTSLDQVRGLPIDILRTYGANFENVEALRGMRLVELYLDSNKVLKDLSPLAGMPLRLLNLFMCSSVTDLSPLHGMPLESLGLDGSGVSDLSPLVGAPLHSIAIGGVTDLRPLAGMPLDQITINGAISVIDFSPLAGVPLKALNGTGSYFNDLTPLLRIPTLERLTTSAMPDKLAPLRKHPKLALINYQNKGFRPVAEFWTELDAQGAAGKK